MTIVRVLLADFRGSDDRTIGVWEGWLLGAFLPIESEA
jgi:hypothetical protein